MNMRLQFQGKIIPSPGCGVRRAVFCFALSSGALTAAAFTPADADTMFEAHHKAFYEKQDGHGWFKESTERGEISYWMRAGQLKMVLDACERPKNAKPRAISPDLRQSDLATAHSGGSAAFLGISQPGGAIAGHATAGSGQTGK